MLTSSLPHYDDIFQAANSVPFRDVLATFHSAEPRKGKIICPFSFHHEKTPSTHIYDNGFYCFGCGRGGDGITFVSTLLGISPLEAAKEIAGRFGLRLEYQQRPTKLKFTELNREREIEERFREKEAVVGSELLHAIRTTRQALENGGWEEIFLYSPRAEPMSELAHKIFYLEYLADLLLKERDAETRIFAVTEAARMVKMWGILVESSLS